MAPKTMQGSLVLAFVAGSVGRKDQSGRAWRRGGRGALEAVSGDMFQPVVGPRLGTPLARDLVIALDKMFGGSLACSLLHMAYQDRKQVLEEREGTKQSNGGEDDHLSALGNDGLSS